MKQEPKIVSAIVEMYLSGKEQKEIVEVTGQSYFVVRFECNWRKNDSFNGGITTPV